MAFKKNDACVCVIFFIETNELSPGKNPFILLFQRL